MVGMYERGWQLTLMTARARSSSAVQSFVAKEKLSFPILVATSGSGWRLQHRLPLPVRPPQGSGAANLFPNRRGRHDRQGLPGDGESGPADKLLRKT